MEELKKMTPSILRVVLSIVVVVFLNLAEVKSQVQKEIYETMVLVKGGTFIMGCRPDEKELCAPWEKPAHRVTLKDFYISKYPVTNKQFCAFLNDDLTGKRFLFLAQVGAASTGMDSSMTKIRYVEKGEYQVEEAYEDHPVTGINWQAAKSFTAWLADKSGLRYRLPTEAEWEYAARGGEASKGFRYSGSDEIGEICADLDEDGRMEVSPVGQFKPNELELYDMTGTVLEWCSDWYKGIYPVGPLTNPQGPEEGRMRVIRGGLVWLGERGGRMPAKHAPNLGFRLAYDPPLKWITD